MRFPNTFDGKALIQTPVIFLALTTGTVGARIWCRYRFRNWGWEDWAILLTQALFVTYCGLLLKMYRTSDDALSLQMVEDHDIDDVGAYIMAAECVYVFTMIFLKISLAFFFLRLTICPWQKATITVVVAVYSLFSFGFFWFVILQCHTLDMRLVVFKMILQQCTSQKLSLGLNYTHSIINAVTDLLCGLPPIFYIRRANYTSRVKYISITLLAFAAIGSVASVVRIFYVKSIVNPEDDFFRNTKDLAIWSTIEPGIGIIVCSLATMRPLFSRWLIQSKLGIRRMSSVGRRNKNNSQRSFWPICLHSRNSRRDTESTYVDDERISRMDDFAMLEKAEDRKHPEDSERLSAYVVGSVKETLPKLSLQINFDR